MTDADVTEPASQHSDAEAPVPYRSGFVAVVGRPNVGKSTLINALIGTQIAIASSRPETTRKAIRGILTTDNAQIVLVDTPGIHRPRTLLGQRLNDVVDESLSDVDAIAFLLPADQEIGPGDKRILSRLRSDFAVKRDDGTFKWKVPLIAIVTKIDELDRSALIDKLIEINEFADFTDIVPVSALEHDNLAEVRNVLVENMPEGPQMYPAEQITEERPEDTIAELIRGAFLEELDDELPHSLAVVVDSIEYPEDNDSGESYAGKAQVIVSIYVERDSQKPITTMLNDNRTLYAYKFEGYWKDVGTIDSLWEANMDLLSSKNELDLGDPSWKIYTEDVTALPQYISAEADVKDAYITQGCVVQGEVKHSVLFTGVKIGAGARIIDSVLMPGVVVEEGAVVQRALVADGVRIGKGAVVGAADSEHIELVAKRVKGAE